MAGPQSQKSTHTVSNYVDLVVLFWKTCGSICSTSFSLCVFCSWKCGSVCSCKHWQSWHSPRIHAFDIGTLAINSDQMMCTSSEDAFRWTALSAWTCTHTHTHTHTRTHTHAIAISFVRHQKKVWITNNEINRDKLRHTLQLFHQSAINVSPQLYNALF